VLHKAALPVGLDPDRLSCINAMPLSGDAIPALPMVAPAQQSC
jgi:hypothetical protein